MIRRTVSLPEAVDALIRAAAEHGESYSATVARLVESGSGRRAGRRQPAFIGVADVDAPQDLARNAEDYLRELLLRDRKPG